MREFVLALRSQVLRELGNAKGLVAGREPNEIVDGPAREILRATLADAVEAFHRQPDRIEALMAASACGLRSVLGQQFANRSGMREFVLALRGQVLRELGNAKGLVAGREPNEIVDGPAREILRATLADAVEAFHRQPDRIDALMAASACGLRSVLGQQFANALALGFRFLGG